MLGRIVALLLTFVFMACKQVPIDKSQFALAAGQSTIVLGGCDKPLELGWSACRFTKGGQIPKLQIFFMNQASYAVSDCNMQIVSSGSTNAGLVEIDLSSLQRDIEARGFCLLKVEAIEHWGENRRYPLAGGFFIETFEPGYLPTPTIPEIAWCYKVARTTAGRTIVERCHADR
jgi:hypothetical protein